MKKLFTLLFSAIVINYSASGQALPNAGFEDWTHHGSGTHAYDNPVGWKTLNPLSSLLEVIPTTKSADAHSGSFSLKSETKFMPAPFNVVAQGIVTTADTIYTSAPYGVGGGIDYTQRPDSLAGWIKYTPVNTDTGYIQMLLMNADLSDTIATAKFETTATISTWTRFSVAFDYRSSNAVELSQTLLSPSSGTQPVVGSAVQFDDLELVFVTGIHEKNVLLKFSVYPNPATEELFIKNPYSETAKMQVFDLTGKKVTDLPIGLNTTKTNISMYSPGVYLYSFINNNSEVLHTGKFVITR